MSDNTIEFPGNNERKMLFRVTGNVPSEGHTTRYYRTSGTDSSLQRYLNRIPTDEGGFDSYSLEEIDKVPEEALIVCPHCGKDFEDTTEVIDID